MSSSPFHPPTPLRISSSTGRLRSPVIGSPTSDDAGSNVSSAVMSPTSEAARGRSSGESHTFNLTSPMHGTSDTPTLQTRAQLRSTPAEQLELGRSVMSSSPPPTFPSHSLSPPIKSSFEPPTAESLSTPSMIAARRALRNDPRIAAWLTVFWRTFPEQSELGVSKQQYLAQHALMYKALHSTYAPEAMYEQGLTDWARDIWFSSSPTHLDEASYLDSLFEVADLWTLTIDADEYIHFLADLYHRITDLRSWIDSSTGAIHTKYMWKRLKYVACAQVYAAFQYKGVTNQQWKEAVDVFHLLDDGRGGDRTMHPHGRDTVEAQQKARAQGLFKGGVTPAAFHAVPNASPGVYQDDEFGDESPPPPNAAPNTATAAMLDPTQILSFLPQPPLQPPAAQFLAPPSEIPAQPRQPMFSDPMRELGLAVLQSNEEDDDDNPNSITGDVATKQRRKKQSNPDDSSAADSDTDAASDSESAADSKKKGGSKSKKKKKGAPSKGTKSVTIVEDDDDDSDGDEPTAEELAAYLAETGEATGIVMPDDTLGRDAGLKAMLISHARVVLKQRKRDQIIHMAQQLQAVIGEPSPPAADADTEAAKTARSSAASRVHSAAPSDPALAPQIVVAEPPPPQPAPTQTLVSIEFGQGAKKERQQKIAPLSSTSSSASSSASRYARPRGPTSAGMYRVPTPPPPEAVPLTAEEEAALRAAEEAQQEQEALLIAELLEPWEEEERKKRAPAVPLGEESDQVNLPDEPSEKTITTASPSNVRDEDYGHSRRFSFFGTKLRGAKISHAPHTIAAAKPPSTSASALTTIPTAAQPAVPSATPIVAPVRRPRVRAYSWPGHETPSPPSISVLPMITPTATLTSNEGVDTTHEVDTSADLTHVVPTDGAEDDTDQPPAAPTRRRNSVDSPLPSAHPPLAAAIVSLPSPSPLGFGLTHRRSVLHASKFALTSKPPPFRALAQLYAKGPEAKAEFAARLQKRTAGRRSRASHTPGSNAATADVTTTAECAVPSVPSEPVDADAVAAQCEVDEFVSSLDVPKPRKPTKRSQRTRPPTGTTLASLPEEDEHESDIHPDGLVMDTHVDADADADATDIVVDPSAIDRIDVDAGVYIDFSSLVGSSDDASEGAAAAHGGCNTPTSLGVRAQYRRVASQRALALEWQWEQVNSRQRLTMSLGANTAAEVMKLVEEMEEQDARIAIKRRQQLRGAPQGDPSDPFTSIDPSSAEDPFVGFAPESVDDTALRLELQESHPSEWEIAGALWSAKYEKRWKGVVLGFMSMQATSHAGKEARRALAKMAAAGQLAGVQAPPDGDLSMVESAEHAFWTAITDQDAQRQLEKQLQAQMAAVLASNASTDVVVEKKKKKKSKESKDGKPKKKKKGEKGEKGDADQVILVDGVEVTVKERKKRRKAKTSEPSTGTTTRAASAAPTARVNPDGTVAADDDETSSPVRLTSDEAYAALVAAGEVDPSIEYNPPPGSEDWTAEEKRIYREREIALDREQKLRTLREDGDAALTEFQWAMKKEEIKEEEKMVDLARRKAEEAHYKDELANQSAEQRMIDDQTHAEQVADAARAQEHDAGDTATGKSKKSKKGKSHKTSAPTSDGEEPSAAATPAETPAASPPASAPRRRRPPQEHAPVIAFFVPPPPPAPVVEEVPEPEPVVEPEPPPVDLAEEEFIAMLAAAAEAGEEVAESELEADMKAAVGKAMAAAVTLPTSTTTDQTAVTDVRVTSAPLTSVKVPPSMPVRPATSMPSGTPAVPPVLPFLPAAGTDSRPSTSRSIGSASFATAVATALPPSARGSAHDSMDVPDDESDLSEPGHYRDVDDIFPVRSGSTAHSEHASNAPSDAEEDSWANDEGMKTPETEASDEEHDALVDPVRAISDQLESASVVPRARGKSAKRGSFAHGARSPAAPPGRKMPRRASELVTSSIVSRSKPATAKSTPVGSKAPSPRANDAEPVEHTIDEYLPSDDEEDALEEEEEEDGEEEEPTSAEEDDADEVADAPPTRSDPSRATTKSVHVAPLQVAAPDARDPHDTHDVDAESTPIESASGASSRRSTHSTATSSVPTPAPEASEDAALPEDSGVDTNHADPTVHMHVPAPISVHVSPAQSRRSSRGSMPTSSAQRTRASSLEEATPTASPVTKSVRITASGPNTRRHLERPGSTQTDGLRQGSRPVTRERSARSDSPSKSTDKSPSRPATNPPLLVTTPLRPRSVASSSPTALLDSPPTPVTEPTNEIFVPPSPMITISPMLRSAPARMPTPEEIALGSSAPAHAKGRSTFEPAHDLNEETASTAFSRAPAAFGAPPTRHAVADAWLTFSGDLSAGHSTGTSTHGMHPRHAHPPPHTDTYFLDTNPVEHAPWLSESDERVVEPSPGALAVQPATPPPAEEPPLAAPVDSSSPVSADDLAYLHVQERLIAVRLSDLARRRAVLLSSESALQSAHSKKSWHLWSTQSHAAGVLAKRFGTIATRIAQINDQKADLAKQLYKEVVLEKRDNTAERAMAAEARRAKRHEETEAHAAEVEARRAAAEQKRVPHIPYRDSSAHLRRQLARSELGAARVHARIAAQAERERVHDEQWEAFQAQWLQEQQAIWTKEITRYRAHQKRLAGGDGSVAESEVVPPPEDPADNNDGLIELPSLVDPSADSQPAIDPSEAAALAAEHEAQKELIVSLMEAARAEVQEARLARKLAANSVTEEKQEPVEAHLQQQATSSTQTRTRRLKANLRPVAPGTLAALIPAPTMRPDEGDLLDIKPAPRAQPPSHKTNSAVAQMAEIPPSEQVSYGSNWVTSHPLDESGAPVAVPTPHTIAHTFDHSDFPPTQSPSFIAPPSPSTSVHSLPESAASVARSLQVASDLRTLSRVISAQGLESRDRDLISHSNACEDVSTLKLVERTDPKKVEARKAELHRRHADEAAAIAEAKAMAKSKPIEPDSAPLFTGTTIDDWLAYIHRDRRARTAALHAEFDSHQRQKQLMMQQKFRQFKRQQADREHALRKAMEEGEGGEEEEEAKGPSEQEQAQEASDVPDAHARRTTSPWDARSPSPSRPVSRPISAAHPAVLDPVAIGGLTASQHEELTAGRSALHDMIPVTRAAAAPSANGNANSRVPRGAHIAMQTNSMAYPLSPATRRQAQLDEKRARSPQREPRSRSLSPDHSPTRLHAYSRDTSPSRLHSPDPPRESTMMLDTGSTATGLLFKQVKHWNESAASIAEATGPIEKKAAEAPHTQMIDTQTGSSAVYFMQSTAPVRGVNPLMSTPQNHRAKKTTSKPTAAVAPTTPNRASRPSNPTTPNMRRETGYTDERSYEFADGADAPSPWDSPQTYFVAADSPVPLASVVAESPHRTIIKESKDARVASAPRRSPKPRANAGAVQPQPTGFDTSPPAILHEEPILLESKPQRKSRDKTRAQAKTTERVEEVAPVTPAANSPHVPVSSGRPASGQSGSARRLQPLDVTPSTPPTGAPMRTMQASASSPAIYASPTFASPSPLPHSQHVSPSSSLRSSPRASLAPLSQLELRRSPAQARRPPPPDDRESHISVSALPSSSSTVAAILSASRASAAKTSIPTAHAPPRHMFVVAASTTNKTMAKSSSSHAIGASQSLREAVHARKEEARLGAIAPVKSALVHAASSFAPPPPVAHSSFGAPAVQIPRLLPPPHRPTPVKLLLGTSASLHQTEAHKHASVVAITNIGAKQG